MTSTEHTLMNRNDIFIEHRNLIYFTIRKNIPLIKALRLEIEDVAQELAISALKAIESYDPSRGMKLTSFILYKLQFEILAVKRQFNRECRMANTTNVSLDYSLYDDEGCEKTSDIPVQVDYDSEINTHEVMGILSEKEKEVVYMRLSGECLTDIRQKRYMDRVRKKVVRYYLRDGHTMRRGRGVV